MDGIDIKVLGGLLKNTSKFGVRGLPKGLYGRIAGDLGLDEDTVRKRVTALQRSGVIAGWDLFVLPSALGCMVHSLRVEVSQDVDKGEVMKRIRLMHGVMSMTDMFGQELNVFIMARNEQSYRKSRELILEISKGRLLFDYIATPPHGDTRLSPTDWNVIWALRRDPTLSYKGLGRAIGASSRASKRRMERLTRVGIMAITPRIDFKKMEGVLPVDLAVSYSDPGLKDSTDGKVASRIGDRTLRIGFGDGSHSHYTYATTGIAAAKEIGDWVKALEGIASIRLDFVHDQLIFPDAFDEFFPANYRRD